MEEVILDTIQWEAPEYSHKERSADWFWTIGLIAIAGFIIALWFHSYVFSIFILISGASLILFTIRAPQQFQFTIETAGIKIGKDMYPWKKITGFTIKKGEPYAKLIVQTTKNFLPVYAILMPTELIPDVQRNLLKVIPQIELEESHSMLFMEKLGF